MKKCGGNMCGGWRTSSTSYTISRPKLFWPARSGRTRATALPIGSHEAVDALISEVLAVEPNHPAHHYRIHLWDDEKASRRWRRRPLCGPSAPAIAHMWHMPGHTYSKLIALRATPRGSKRPRRAVDHAVHDARLRFAGSNSQLCAQRRVVDSQSDFSGPGPAGDRSGRDACSICRGIRATTCSTAKAALRMAGRGCWMCWSATSCGPRRFNSTSRLSRTSGEPAAGFAAHSGSGGCVFPHVAMRARGREQIAALRGHVSRREKAAAGKEASQKRCGCAKRMPRQKASATS